MSLPAKTKFDPGFPIAGPGGAPTQSFRDYMAKLDALVSMLVNGNLAASLVNAANDAAAATAGVGVGQIYRNGSVLMVRVV